MKLPAPPRRKSAPHQGQMLPRGQSFSSHNAPEIPAKTGFLARLWRPRGLFFKIFGWFLAAQLLIACALYALATATQRSFDQSLREQIGASLESRARAAAIAYENGGATALGEAWQSAQFRPDFGGRGRNNGAPRRGAQSGANANSANRSHFNANNSGAANPKRSANRNQAGASISNGTNRNQAGSNGSGTNGNGPNDSTNGDSVRDGDGEPFGDREPPDGDSPPDLGPPDGFGGGTGRGFGGRFGRGPNERESASLYVLRAVPGQTAILNAQHLIGPVAPSQQFRVAANDETAPDAIKAGTGVNYLLRRVRTARGGRYLAVMRVRLESERPGRSLGDWLVGGPNRATAPWRFGVILLTMGALCYVLARYLTDPAIKLRRATRQFAAGDFATRVGPQMGARRDELADLGHDFDQMAERIETLLLSQRQLLGDISHELRSPLTRLSLAVELATQKADDPTRALLGRIEGEIGEMNRLISQLLTIAKLENGASFNQQTSREAAYIDLAHLIEHVAANADFEAKSRGGSVVITHIEACQIVGDGELLHSALENVVRNAILHGPDGGRVEISLHVATRENQSANGSHGNGNHASSGHAKNNDGDGSRGARNGDENARTAWIRVRDYGSGVPDEALESLFRPFFRVDAARNRNSGGTGLGLSIAQRAARFHGGDMSARNAPGGGLEVEISLPIPATSSETELMAAL